MRNDSLVVIGPTGSGKTTQLPQFILLYEASMKRNGNFNRNVRIAVTQPRRVGAVSIASRVANEMGTNLGKRVGYHVRFDNTTSQDTVVTYLTDGMLLREIMVKKLLLKYDYIILDEAHERTLNTDILFGLLKALQKKRNDVNNDYKKLKLIIMSATLQSDKFATYFNANIFRLKGFMYPVDCLYLSKNENNYLDTTLIAILQTHIDSPFPGDILAFLTGQDEIETLKKILLKKIQLLKPNQKKLKILTLYSNLPNHIQKEVFEINGNESKYYRRVILSTNIAETSITIPNIKYVIDSGKVKRKYFNPNTCIDEYRVVNVSKSEAWQRCGRAGRICKGYCLRLYTENHFEYSLDEDIIPEIKRSNLRSVVLMLKKIGIKSVNKFDLIDKPDGNLVNASLSELFMLSALDMKTHKLTELGRQMCIFPLDPMYCKVLLKSNKYYCTKEILYIISLLSIDAQLFYYDSNKRSEFNDMKLNRFEGKEFGDIIILLHIFMNYLQIKSTKKRIKFCKDNFINHKSIEKAIKVYNQFEGLYKQYINNNIVSIFDKINNDDIKDSYSDVISKCMLEGLFLNSAKYNDSLGCYETNMNNIKVNIHPSSVLFSCNKNKPKNVMYCSIVKTKESNWIRDLLVFDEISWFDDIINTIDI